MPRSHEQLLRLLLVVAAATTLFTILLIPIRIQGESMAPRYHTGMFNFCWTGSYWFHEPQRFDVVLITLAGPKVMLLKRIIALPGETIAFQDGQTLINGQPLAEPYIKNPWGWTMTPRVIPTGTVYVVGDNRDMAMDSHTFGSAALNRIKGQPLW